MILCNFFLISYQSPIILSYYVLKKLFQLTIF